MSKTIANIIQNDLKGLLNKHKLKIQDCPIAPEVIGFFGRAIDSGDLTKKQVKKFLVDFFEENLEKKKTNESI